MTWYSLYKISQQQTLTLYHGTSSGPNDQNLRSFRQGVDPQRASGWGQGSGFYAYTDLQSAQEVALSRVDPMDAATKDGEHGGRPMVVSVTVPAQSVQMDAENYGVLSRLVAKHWTVFQSIPQIPTQYGIVYPPKCQLRQDGLLLQVDNRKMGVAFNSDGGQIRYGQIFAPIMQALAAINPAIQQESQQMIQSGTPVKYVGPPVQAQNILVLMNGRWTDVTHQEPIETDQLRAPSVPVAPA